MHNTETDPIWGCGYDLCGTNMMGKILMNVRQRDTDYQTNFPELPPVAKRPSSTARPAATVRFAPHPRRQPKVLVIGNSNARGLSQGLIERGVDSTGSVYPGQSIARIRDNARRSQVKSDVILLHVGDIEIRDVNTPVESVVTDMKNLAMDLRKRCPSASILISGLPPVAQNRPLSKRIEDCNSALARFCSDNANFLHICNRSAKLRRDGIHLTLQSKDIIARTAAHHVKRCV